MRALASGLAIMITAGASAGCGGDSGGPGPDPAELTSVEVSPASVTLFTVAPDNSITLAVAVLDQNGDPMAGAGAPSFSSTNSAVADVGDDGTISAVGAGTAQVTASVTAGGVTKTGTSSVTVQVAAAAVQVFAPQFVFEPATVDVRAGGSVTWTFGPIHHDVTFTTQGAPANIPELENGSALRTFPDNGTFAYLCSIHPSMRGSVRAH